MPKCIDAFDKKAEDALYVELCIFNGYHFETIVLSKDTDGIWKSPLWCIRDRFMRYELLAKRTNYALERVCIFDSSKGDLRLVDVTAGQGGKSYMNYLKVPQRLEDSCREINERKEQLLKNPGVYDQFRLNFDAHLQLVTTHSWVDGNDRMSRLIMNYLQNESGLVSNKVLKEDKAEYINALVKSREDKSSVPFQDFMFREHAKNLQQEIENYKLSM
ncbi:Fic family protein [Bacteroides heparinolyticus]|uniref:Fic family protein n=1 Tax=Prevotella heparinolytica TaxID=28113 RepID=UPI0035A064FC